MKITFPDLCGWTKCASSITINDKVQGTLSKRIVGLQFLIAMCCIVLRCKIVSTYCRLHTKKALLSSRWQGFFLCLSCFGFRRK